MTQSINCAKLRKRLERIRSKKAACSAREISGLLSAFGFESRISSNSHDVWSGYGKTITIARPKQKHLKVPYVVQALRLCEQVYLQRCDSNIYEVK